MNSSLAGFLMVLFSSLQILVLIGRIPHGLAFIESKWGLKIHLATSTWALDIVSIILMTERRHYLNFFFLWEDDIQVILIFEKMTYKSFWSFTSIWRWISSFVRIL